MHSFTTLAASALALLATFAAALPTEVDNIKKLPRASPVHDSEFKTLGCPSKSQPVASEAQQFEVANDFAKQLFVNKKVSQAFNAHVARDLINHAPDVPGDGAATAEPVVSGLLASATVELQWTNVGQNYATTYFKATSPQGTIASTDIFRMVGTCLVEHWVIVQPVINNTQNWHPFF